MNVNREKVTKLDWPREVGRRAPRRDLGDAEKVNEGHRWITKGVFGKRPLGPRPLGNRGICEPRGGGGSLENTYPGKKKLGTLDCTRLVSRV